MNSTGDVGSLYLPSFDLLLIVVSNFVPEGKFSSGMAVLSAVRVIVLVSPVSVFVKVTSTVSTSGLEVEYDNEALLG